jgi:cell wall-associated NlpC family hydrolase
MSDASVQFARRGLPLLRLIPALACVLAVGCASPPAPPLPGAGIERLTADQSKDAAIEALGLVGTPYRYGGNTPQGGFDCSGLIGYVFRQIGAPPTPRTVARMAGAGRPVPMSEIRTGDLLLFGAATPWHAGIYVGEGRFVHAPSTGGEVRLDHLDNVYWARQPVQARRL